ncbi:helix-turn-helix domain-containing protein [Bradyrhizobium iriomotense]|uniref:helix-turn-helix domain-containing protein n=1 Tax=Bradyrhizobium iriomotense TaxID=441950 RepID=UPI0024E080C9|nr:helix-turn-helix domain-containing protein [Bradyrhizobium iriomotense]
MPAHRKHKQSNNAAGGPLAVRRQGPDRTRNQSDKFFTITEVGEVLHVSTRSIRRWISAGELASHRFGGAVRISRVDLEIFVAKSREYSG